MNSNALGSVKITSRDPDVEAGAALQLPLDRPGSHGVGAGDRRGAEDPSTTCVRRVRRRRSPPGLSVQTDEEILDWVRKDAETALHPSCSCKMGTDELAVVDPATMGVRGLEQASRRGRVRLPSITNANLYAPVTMVAERLRPDRQRIAGDPCRSTGTGRSSPPPALPPRLVLVVVESPCDGALGTAGVRGRDHERDLRAGGVRRVQLLRPLPRRSSSEAGSSDPAIAFSGVQRSACSRRA